MSVITASFHSTYNASTAVREILDFGVPQDHVLLSLRDAHAEKREGAVSHPNALYALGFGALVGFGAGAAFSLFMAHIVGSALAYLVTPLLGAGLGAIVGALFGSMSDAEAAGDYADEAVLTADVEDVRVPAIRDIIRRRHGTEREHWLRLANPSSASLSPPQTRGIAEDEILGGRASDAGTGATPDIHRDTEQLRSGSPLTPFTHNR